MGKKERNRLTPKKNNHVSESALETYSVAHEKEHSSEKRKNGPGNHMRDY